MDSLQGMNGLWFAVIGWAATAWLIWGQTRVAVDRRRSQVWVAGILWLAYALGALVAHGILRANEAILGGVIVAAVTLLVAVAPLPRRLRRR